MTLQQIIEDCAAITKSKGFKTDQHATQIALIATEVAEALECTTGNINSETLGFISDLRTIASRFETYRKQHKIDYVDDSAVSDQEHLNEELADIVIRVFSYVGGNGQTENFLKALAAKMHKNKQRPHLHGKNF